MFNLNSGSAKNILPFLLILFLFNQKVNGQAYVKDMPGLEKLKTEFSSGNNGYAKQAAAMEILIQMINVNILHDNASAQQVLMNSYHQAQQQLQQQYLNNGGNLQDWFKNVGKYEVDKDFEKTTVYNLLGPLAKRKYDEIQKNNQDIEDSYQAREDFKKRQEDQEASRAAKLIFTQRAITLAGFPVLLFGLWMFRRAYRSTLALQEYEFENTTDGGTVEFNSFNQARQHGFDKVKTRGSVWLAAIFTVGGLAMIIGGCYFR